MHHKLILTVFFSIAFLIGSATQEQTFLKSTHSQPAPFTADSSDVQTSVPFANNLPATAAFHNQKECQVEKNITTDFQMPIFIPDSSLTASMPIFSPPPVDEKMIIPIDQLSINPCR